MSERNTSEPSPDTPPEFGWRYRVHELGKDGRDLKLLATPAQCQALAQSLDLLGCTSVRLIARLTPLSRHRCRLAGRLEAKVTQACVATLEPVDETIVRDIDIEFWPESDLTAQASASFDALGSDDPEPLDGETADVGRLVYQLVGAGLDPYPRKAGAAATWNDPAPKPEQKANPFSVLANLKPKLDRREP